MTMVMLNGRLEPAERAMVPALDRGLTHGLGLYETFKLVGGVPVFFDEHEARLRKGLAVLEIELPESPAELAGQIVHVSQAAQVPDGACRLLVTGGPPQGPPTVLVQVEVRLFPDRALKLVSHMALRSTADLKSKSFTTSHLAMRAAKAVGADDALFVDEGGRAHEATTANLFVHTGGHLITPPLDGSILPGVVRTRMLELCAAAGTPVAEEPVYADRLGAEDVVLLTSSVRGIVLGASLDGRPLKEDRELLGRLQGLLRDAESASAARFRARFVG
jgi:branched-subunit amino acid aminotransferase/4-amino-4-deoxychorismate lyase